MARASRSSSVDAKLEALKAIRRGSLTDGVEKILDECLRDGNWLVVSEACETASQLDPRRFEKPLRAVWARFVENAVKRDPGCRAKLAALKALDSMELLDSEPFVHAIRYRQLEPVLGGKVDTAGPLRVRCLMALLRMMDPQAALYAGELFADPDAEVRAGVAQAIGHYASPNTTALLVYKLRLGDSEPAVSLEAALALLGVETEFALDLLKPWLSEPDVTKRETAAMALGQSRDLDATRVLLEWVEAGANDADQALAIRALGLSRDERARRYLLGIVERGPSARARAAVEALAIHRYDSQLLDLVRKAVSAREDETLMGFVERVFQA